MDMEVKQILKSLCFSYGWSYAVYWRSDPINPIQGRIWAHLIVEAKPHITRLQLFYSLVHLFQQQNPPHSSSFDHQT
ncbi:hypothetical protein BRARA_I01288 [Brassica rapa]|uniref:Transcription factor MYC/MYB N-terminal domain-containing protein n=1 Tax=Brassica campestris TaxID=3711 RepID=A0A397Y170_BRACM|nr:hypothetical protein BRARA_I01288 [Brassica rapa]